MECKKSSAMESGTKQTDFEATLKNFKEELDDEEKEIEATSIKEIYLDDKEL